MKLLQYNNKILQKNQSEIYIDQNSLFNDLQSYWDFDHNANDIHRKNNGLIIGATSGQTGILNDCYYYDGIDDYLNFGDVTFLDNLTTLSVSCWIYPDNITAVGSPINKSNGTPVNNYTERTFALLYNPTIETNNLAFWIFTYAGNVHARSFYQVDETRQNEWLHVVFTWEYNVVGIGQIFINGVSKTVTKVIDQGPEPTSLYPSNSNLQIGAGNNTDADWPFKGKVDEVGIWNKVLTQGDVDRLYNSGYGLSYKNFRY